MTDDSVRELARLRDWATDIVNTPANWETKYDRIFCDELSNRVYKLDRNFSYYDPDTSYEEDCLAFVHALKDRVAELEKTMPGSPNG